MRNILRNRKILYITIIVLVKVSVLSVIYAFTGNDNKVSEHVGVVLSKFDSIGLRTNQIQLPNNLTFASETVPLEYFDVRESLDREMQVNTFYHSQTILLLKKANRYFPIIEPILKEKGIPEDFKYLCVIESSLSNAVSPSKAVGFWQILENTGKELGLEINNEVDERYSIEKSTYAACKFLLKSYEKFGNWTMAAASYNFGRNGIDKQMDRQENESYYNLVLGEETGRYIYRILAVKLIFEDPIKYGFDLKKSDLYPPLSYFEVKVDTSITNISAFARYHNTNYKMLKYFNPWLRESYLPNKSAKKYTILIPSKDYRSTAYERQ
jgi:hypothetical protein